MIYINTAYLWVVSCYLLFELPQIYQIELYKNKTNFHNDVNTEWYFKTSSCDGIRSLMFVIGTTLKMNGDGTLYLITSFLIHCASRHPTDLIKRSSYVRFLNKKFEFFFLILLLKKNLIHVLLLIFFSLDLNIQLLFCWNPHVGNLAFQPPCPALLTILNYIICLNPSWNSEVLRTASEGYVVTAVKKKKKNIYISAKKGSTEKLLDS